MFRTRISAVAAFLCALQFMLWGLIVHTHNQKDNSEATDVSFNRTFDHPYLKLTGDKAKGTTTHVRGSEICDIDIQHSSHNPLIAIALATTSRHMSERINDPAKRRTELLRKNQHISSTVGMQNDVILTHPPVSHALGLYDSRHQLQCHEIIVPLSHTVAVGVCVCVSSHSQPIETLSFH